MINELDTLDPDTAAGIVVEATPHPEKFRGPDQLLKDLGVIGDIEVEVHKAGIIKAVIKVGFRIDANDIASGPAVNVGDCTTSVVDNATK